tara:strand:+ start:27 stop:335 length:309 start_codon:yes stop_codon:yes gene_type:complete
MDQPIQFRNLGSLEDQFLDQRYAITSWSFIHLTSGFALGLTCYLFRGMVSYTVSSAIAVVLLAAWEPFEAYAWAKEHLMNQHTDFLIGYLALYLTLMWADAT